jgi:hypothetical protein
MADTITQPYPFRIAPVLDVGPAARRSADPALSMLWGHANSGVEVS